MRGINLIARRAAALIGHLAPITMASCADGLFRASRSAHPYRPFPPCRSAPRMLMNHRHLAMRFALVAAVFALGQACASAADRPPNVIIILSDDQGYADVGCFGAEGFTTPRSRSHGRRGDAVPGISRGVVGLLAIAGSAVDRLVSAARRVAGRARSRLALRLECRGRDNSRTAQAGRLRHRHGGQMASRRPAAVSAHPARLRRIFRHSLLERSMAAASDQKDLLPRSAADGSRPGDRIQPGPNAIGAPLHGASDPVHRAQSEAAVLSVSVSPHAARPVVSCRSRSAASRLAGPMATPAWSSIGRWAKYSTRSSGWTSTNKRW